MGPTINSSASPDSETPYLSVVATARNDDHGGNLLRRMQIFADAWIAQAKRHQLPCELILVEWNPPLNREPLATALRWPRETGPCQVRIIEVPPELHARYRYASVLPLYQMIAKNVGILRARGEFILATNIDIIFSDELMRFLAQRRLEKARMYRIDRTDVMSDVPLNGTLDEQLCYCRSHVIRVCSREGTYTLTPDGFRENETDDITSPDSGIHFGKGWFAAEQWERTERFRWIGAEAEIIISKAPRDSGLLKLDVEAGPGIDWNVAILEVLDDSGALMAEYKINGRSKLELVLPPPMCKSTRSFRLRARSGGVPLVDDPRILTFRIFRCDWVHAEPRHVPPAPALAVLRECRPLLARLFKRSSLVEAPSIMQCAIRLLRRRGDDVFEAGMEYRMGTGWYELENAGSERFRWASQDAQLAVRITDDRRSLALIVEPGPGIGFQPFHLLVRDAAGEVLGRILVHGVTYADLALPMHPGTLATLVLTTEGGGPRVGADPRQLNFRVYACGGGVRKGSTEPAASVPSRFWMAREVASAPSDPDWIEVLEKSRAPVADAGCQTFLHTNGCGDFTLMARENWHDLRGYPELDLFSMHLDSILCCAAHHAGIREVVLAEPMRIYHVEHAVGSGWTPEGQQRLYDRLAQKGIQCISYEEVVWLISQMRRIDAPVIFNLDGWGCADTMLAENCPTNATQASGTGC